ncbi:MAG: hypothetical protein ACRDGL_10140, partial [Candidatus Limnocylindrales bacterium]
MNKLRTRLLALVLPLVIVGGFASTAFANGGPAGKVNICHFASHKYVEINVSVHAEPAHLAHGDVLPDQYGA